MRTLAEGIPGEFPREISVEGILSAYEGILFDAFGVLVQGHGAIPGAVRLIDRLNRSGFPYWIVSNGSCFSVARTAESYQCRGLNIPEDRVITSGSLVPVWLKKHGFSGSRLRILGPDSCSFMARESGSTLTGGDDFDVLIIGNQSGYPLLATVDQIISALFRRMDAGTMPALLLPNPDLIYPGKPGSFGMTCGMVATVIESALRVRYQGAAPEFVRLGKPFSPIFEEARRRAGHLKLVMIGDQMDTDIRGAIGVGLDSILIGTGVSRPYEPGTYEGAVQPTFRMPSF